MTYPLIIEYIGAIKAAEDNFEQLCNLRPVLDENGNPIMTSGNFAVVFKMKDKQTGKLHAVKCFLKEQEGRAEAYRMIAEELEYVNSTFLTPIKYLDKELFVDSKNSDETEFPVLLMDWVEGKTLDKYIREHIDDQYELSLLAYQFSRLAMWLMPQPFAHGDLKPDNILVKNDGTLVLVDYDGMYVPAMKGQKARELGSPDFRHPSRTEDDFNEHIDDFSLVSILLSLKAIALQPELLEQYGAKDRLLFSENDYRNMSNSKLLKEIFPSDDSQLNLLYGLFVIAIEKTNLINYSFRIFDLDRPNFKGTSIKSTCKNLHADLIDSWVDNFGARYSKDWKRLIKGPNVKVVESMIINNQNFNKADMWVSQPCKSKTGKTTYWCAFDSFEDGILIFLSSLVWKDLSMVNPDTLWKVFSKGNYIVREAHDTETNKWMMDDNNHPIMMISPMREMVQGSFESGNTKRYFKELSETTEYSIKQGTEIICSNAFENCIALKTISIPNSVNRIGAQSFIDCVSLEHIYVPTGCLNKYVLLLPEYKHLLSELP